MAANTTDSHFLASRTPSGDMITVQSEKRDLTRTSLSAPKKLLGLMSGLMDILVEGLAPGVKPQRRSYDLIVVGAGPAGTAAAICAAREGIDSLIVEAGEVEGGAQILRCMDNPATYYKGSTLVSQDESTEDQGRSFVLEIRPEMAVTGIRAEGGFWQVETEHGLALEARSLILAPGSSPRRLDVPGEETLASAGVHSGANRDGAAYTGKDLVVIGAGNSGIERAFYLATFAKSVTVVDQSSRARCSRELYQQAKARPNITIKFNLIVREFKGNRMLSSVLVEDAKTGDIEELYASAAFVMIGSEPATSAFRASVCLDQSGFIKTNRSLQTNLPGVFAAGHARSGLIQRSNAGASEGCEAAMSVRKYLADANG